MKTAVIFERQIDVRRFKIARILRNQFTKTDLQIDKNRYEPGIGINNIDVLPKNKKKTGFLFFIKNNRVRRRNATATL